MKGQIWTEYLIIAAVFVLVGLLATSFVYPTTKDAVVCSAIHMGVLSEITKEEVNTLHDYTLKNVSCDLQKGEVNIYCECSDKNAVKNIAEVTLKRTGEENVNVEVFG